jgi:hypothetical protein
MDITSYELLVGTVEEFVLGYRISRKLKQKGEYELTQSFTSRYWATSGVMDPDPHSFWWPDPHWEHGYGSRRDQNDAQK